ncbi:DUF7344 domain-containing protein [Halopiger xanaduensis]|uniref:DUF7344 domain-containing protein n=1 Tax=Halopiger xanaduensis (strain DSM 18323 / JCM 14033 / SH-6) TaxID=797210 RepID=F8DAF9_HALXS|nr:hypothetical protein [Halopiger xanaduensis]AEH38165.1 hypothetical protein Halxa_3554 [Halopiger xanaduensis SH-6]
MGATHAKPSGGTDSSKANVDTKSNTELGTDAGDRAGNQSDATGTEPILTEDELFEILSNRRRRHILHELMREGDTLDIGTLSQQIAAWEDGLELHEVTSSDRKRVYTALHQSHLPKMDEAGVVDFNQDRGTVSPTPALEDVEIYMDIVRGREIPWSDYYLGLTGLSGLLLAAVSLSLGPFAAISHASWGVFVVVAFGISALAHRYYARRNRLGIAEEPPSSDLEFEYRDPTDAGTER